MSCKFGRQIRRGRATGPWATPAVASVTVSVQAGPGGRVTSNPNPRPTSSALRPSLGRGQGRAWRVLTPVRTAAHIRAIRSATYVLVLARSATAPPMRGHTWVGRKGKRNGGRVAPGAWGHQSGGRCLRYSSSCILARVSGDSVRTQRCPAERRVDDAHPGGKTGAPLQQGESGNSAGEGWAEEDVGLGHCVEGGRLLAPHGAPQRHPRHLGALHPGPGRRSGGGLGGRVGGSPWQGWRHSRPALGGPPTKGVVGLGDDAPYRRACSIGGCAQVDRRHMYKGKPAHTRTRVCADMCAHTNAHAHRARTHARTACACKHMHVCTHMHTDARAWTGACTSGAPCQ